MAELNPLPTMQLRHVLCGLLLVMGCSLASATDRAPSVGTWPSNVGGTSIALPIPAGYEEASLVAPTARQVGERLVPPTNRLLAYFVDPVEVQDVLARRSALLKRYFMVQTLRQTEGVQLSSADFNNARNLIREHYKQFLPAAARVMQEQVSSAVRELGSTYSSSLTDLRLGEVRGLDVFVDDEQAIALLAVTKVAVENAGTRTEVPMVMAMNTVLVGRKLVYFYAYSVHTGPQDLEWVRAQSKAWLERASATNP